MFSYITIMFDILFNYMNRYVSFTKEDIHNFIQFTTQETYNKKNILLKEGQVCNQYFFILKGIIRIYQYSPKGKEIITLFGKENWWITDHESFTLQTPSSQYIQALEKLEILSLTHHNYEKALCSNPKLERFFRIITERAYIASQRRTLHLTQLSIEDRYHTFVNGTDGFTHRIPQYMLASYLDCTPEFLSTIKAQSF